MEKIYVSDRPGSWTRRAFVGGLTRAGAAGLLGAGVGVVAAEPSPEKAKLRVLRSPSLCEAPAQVADTLLAAEGFTEVQYVRVGGAGARWGLACQVYELGLTDPMLQRSSWLRDLLGEKVPPGVRRRDGEATGDFWQVMAEVQRALEE